MKAFLWVQIICSGLGCIAYILYLARGDYPRSREDVTPLGDAFNLLGAMAFLFWAIQLLP